jgi:hypothetical protein
LAIAVDQGNDHAEREATPLREFRRRRHAPPFIV